MANEEKEVYLKNVKKTSVKLGELIQQENWDEADKVSSDLNELLKAQPDDLTRGEMVKYHFEEMSQELRKFWYFRKELLKTLGALSKKGERFVEWGSSK